MFQKYIEQMKYLKKKYMINLIFKNKKNSLTATRANIFQKTDISRTLNFGLQS